MITVKLIELGSQIKEYCLEDDSVLADLLNAAEKSNTDKVTITRDGSEIEEDESIFDGDRIFIGKAMKGNLEPFEVKFIRLGGTSISLPAEDGYTIKRTLEQMDSTDKRNFYREDGSVAYEFRIGGGRPVDEDHVLVRPESGSLRVICAQRVKGNE